MLFCLCNCLYTYVYNWFTIALSVSSQSGRSRGWTFLCSSGTKSSSSECIEDFIFLEREIWEISVRISISMKIVSMNTVQKENIVPETLATFPGHKLPLSLPHPYPIKLIQFSEAVPRCVCVLCLSTHHWPRSCLHPLTRINFSPSSPAQCAKGLATLLQEKQRSRLWLAICYTRSWKSH